MCANEVPVNVTFGEAEKASMQTMHADDNGHARSNKFQIDSRSKLGTS